MVLYLLIYLQHIGGFLQSYRKNVALQLLMSTINGGKLNSWLLLQKVVHVTATAGKLQHPKLLYVAAAWAYNISMHVRCSKRSPSAAHNLKYGLPKCPLIRILYCLFELCFVTGCDPSPQWEASTGLPDGARGWLGGESRAWCSPSREVLAGLTSEYTHGLLASRYYTPSLNQLKWYQVWYV